MRLKNTSGVTAATAAALLFGAAFSGSTFASDEAKIHCTGVNACKGQNSCKSKGFLEMTRKECDDAKAKMQAAQGG